MALRIFHWNKDLELGIETIDEQHKMLIEKVNTFFIRTSRLNLEENRLDSLQFLDYLERSCLLHFKFEETYFSDSNYPFYRDHQAKHKWLHTQLKIFTIKLSGADFTQSDLDNFYELLIDWVTSHILEEDIQFVNYYKSHQ